MARHQRAERLYLRGRGEAALGQHRAVLPLEDSLAKVEADLLNVHVECGRELDVAFSYSLVAGRPIPDPGR